MKAIEFIETDVATFQQAKPTIDDISERFAQYIDKRSLEKLYNMLKSKGMPSSEEVQVMFCIAATCAKHYNDGYDNACSETHPYNLLTPRHYVG